MAHFSIIVPSSLQKKVSPSCVGTLLVFMHMYCLHISSCADFEVQLVCSLPVPAVSNPHSTYNDDGDGQTLQGLCYR